jgi:simple sugar transport system substrate-binding protein
LGPSSAHPAIEALRAARKRDPNGDRPRLVTFDLSSQIVSGVRDGHVAFAIDQQPYAQGYLPVALLGVYLQSGKSMPMRTLKLVAFTRDDLHRRMSRYDIALKPSDGRNVNSGPAFVTRVNVEQVERFSGTYR